MRNTVIVVVVGLLWTIFLFNRANGVDVGAHDDLVERFGDLKRQDEDLQRDVLAVRYGFIADYDSIVVAAAALDTDAAAVIAAVDGDPAGAALSQAVAARRAVVERFKPQNSVLGNSLRYLPSATAAFVDDATAAGVDKGVIARAWSLEAETLALDLRDPAALRALEGRASAFAVDVEALPPAVRDAGRALVRHSSRVARDAVHLQPVLEELLSPDVAVAADALAAVHARRFAHACDVEDRWRGVLWIWAAVVFGVVVLLLRRLWLIYGQLEQRVRERTAALRNILDHVASGFLLVDAALTVQPGFSESCRALLGVDDVAGRSLIALLQAPADRAAWLQLAVAQTFEGLLPDDVALAQLPTRHTVGARALRLVPRVVREQGRVRFLLITIDDVTALEAAERSAAHNQLLVRVLRDKEAFAAFVDETHGQLARAGDHLDDDVVVRRAVHTVKGAAATWGLDDLAGLCHGVEEREVIGADDIAAVAAALDAFIGDSDGLKDALFGARGVEVSAGDVDVLAGLVDDDDQAGLRRFVARLRLQRADALLGPLKSYAERLGQRLDKPTRFTLEGGATPIDGARLGPLFSLLPHLVRNAVDHGVEARGERGAKPEVAHVAVTVALDDGDVVIAVADDGKGIDVEALVVRAKEKGVDAPDVDALAALVFVDGVSTAAGVSDVSGRGVGLSAVKEAVEALGGAVSVASDAGRGTVVTLRVPSAHQPHF